MNEKKKLNIKEEIIKFCNLQFKDYELFNEKLPVTTPFLQEDIDNCRKYWNIGIYPDKTRNMMYVHTKEEENEIIKITKELLADYNDCYCSLLYDPKAKKILQRSKTNKNQVNPINHTIMNLIKEFSNNIANIDESNTEQEEALIECDNNDNTLINKKITKAPFNEYLDYEQQYYCQNLYVFTVKEPCFMCAMALVHSRIDRLYFINLNNFDGAITSKLKIIDYESLNHSYLCYKLNIN